MERLDALLQRGYMFGHQDDPFYGLTWEYMRDSSDVKNVCCDYPAVMGFEVGGIEMGDEKSLDSVPFTKITEEIINHYNRGGVITISWHSRNPLTTIDGGAQAGQLYPEGTAWDVSDTTVVKSILPGGSKHPLMTELDHVVDIYQAMGFNVMEPRQLDDEFHMFDSLNFSKGHPARDGYDTFRTAEGF